MRRRGIYIGLLLLLLAGLLADQFGFLRRMTETGVRRAGGEAFWQPQWQSLIAQEVNGEGIRFLVDGTEIPSGKNPVVLSEEGEFLIPVSRLAEVFSCTALFYDRSRLVMERGDITAQLEEGSAILEVNGEAIPLETGLAWRDGALYVPLAAVEQAFSYRREWKPEERTLALTGGGTEKKFLPYAYDYREKGRAPQVKNQGSLGTCWAFASLMALESRLLPEYDLDFSEDHMSLQNSFHLDQNAGGEYTMSMAYLLAWQGPVLESQDPYGDGISPQGLSPVCHVQEIRVLPGKDYEAIKRAVYLYGGVQSSLYTSMVTGQSDQRYYNKETGAYCYIGTARPNHDVVIIGWDDTYPKENFNLTPEGDGAFICANSWGGEFGDDGYFYVSYYDSNIGSHNILYSRVEAADNYDQIYQTDLCGWVGQLGYGKENAWFANIYTARGREKLEAVGFYATGANTSYEVYTVSDAEGSSRFGRRRLAASGTLADAGYYTIDLKRPLRLEEGERFAVIVSVWTPGAVHPVAIEYNSPDKGLTADLSDGEGYISFRGTVWERVEKEQDCNVCLKAYTKSLEESE